METSLIPAQQTSPWLFFPEELSADELLWHAAYGLASERDQAAEELALRARERVWS